MRFTPQSRSHSFGARLSRELRRFFKELSDLLRTGQTAPPRVIIIKQTWDDLEPEGAFDLVPHCKLAKVYDPALSRLELVIQRGHNIESTFVGPSDKQERIVFSVKLQADLWNGHCQQRSNRILKNVNFVAASRPDSPIRPRLRQVVWRQGIASDEELMDRATGKMVGIDGSAISSMTGQLLTTAEIGEVRGLSRGALDPEFDAEEDAAREMYFQSDL